MIFSDFMFKKSPHCERQSSCCQMLNSFLRVNIRYFAIIFSTATNFPQQLLVERKTERKRKREVCWLRLKMQTSNLLNCVQSSINSNGDMFMDIDNKIFKIKRMRNPSNSFLVP